MTNRTSVEAVLNTLEHERHARSALLVAFGDELRAAMPDEAPESTRTLIAIAKAERGEMDDASFSTLLNDLREIVRAA